MKSIIIYTTKYGSVEKAAKILESQLNGEVKLVNIMKEKAPNIDEFDNVMLGGSIYVGKIQKELKNFMDANSKKLLEKRLGIFICAGEQDDEKRIKQFENAFPKELYNHASAKEIFGDEVQIEKVNFFERLALRLIKGVTQSYSKLFEENIEKFAKQML